MQGLISRKGWLAALLITLLGIVLTGSALAAETASGEVYRLAAGEVVEDDLYVGAGEIYIDGTIEGDLIATGGYIEINGVVTGDAILAGGGINLSGNVQDDVRAAGAGITVSGTIGDDLVAAGGGGQPFAFPFQVNGRTIEQGVHLTDSAQVGGDALIGGGEGDIGGTIGGRLQAAMGQIALAAQVGEEAQLFSNNIEVADTAQVAETLTYSSDRQMAIPEGVAAEVEHNPLSQQVQADPANTFLGWLIRTLLVLVGFALLGWLLLRFAPTLLLKPANAIAARPGRASLYGLLTAVAFIFIPLASLLLILVMALFWGWLPAVVMGLFLVGVLALIWFLSPLVTGLWLGRWFNTRLGRTSGDLPILLGGILLLALLGQIPIVGWLVYLASFILALGGLILARRSGGGGALSPVTESQPAPPPVVPANLRRA